MELTEKQLQDLIDVWARKIGIRDRIRKISRDNRRTHSMWVISVEGTDKYDLGYLTREGWDDSEMWRVLGCIFHEFGHIMSRADRTEYSTEKEMADEEELAERMALKLFSKYLPDLKQPYMDWIRGVLQREREYYINSGFYYIMAFDRIYGNNPNPRGQNE